VKIETNDYLTAHQVALMMNCNRRAVFRAAKRARQAGEETTVTILGRRLFTQGCVEILKKYYFPYYSDAHQDNVRKWGAMGGLKKAQNRANSGDASKNGS
jgi:hypothetical protein